MKKKCDCGHCMLKDTVFKEDTCTYYKKNLCVAQKECAIKVKGK